MNKGLVIIYIGDGKGKTTAATGLAVRAAGSGMKVAFTQFMKGEWPSGELTALPKLGIEVNIFGKGFVGIQGDQKPLAEHKEEAERAYEMALKQVKSGRYDLVVLDELISAVEEQALGLNQVIDMVKSKAEKTHLCLTGHKKYDELLELADLVTEMKKLKHPYDQGLLAVKGIDY